MSIAPGISPATMPGAPPIPPKPTAAPEPEEAGVPADVFVLPPFTPEPAALSAPQPPRPPLLALSREQHIRRVALELAVKHHADLDCQPDDVLTAAKTWAHWVRTGTDTPR